MKKEIKYKISANAYEFAKKHHHNLTNIEMAVLEDMLKDFAISQLESLQKPELSAEEMLEKFAKKNMIEWDQKSFKRTHRLLHISIIQAINEALNLHNISQVNRIVCPNCGDHGWIYNEDATSRKTCPCHY